MIPNGLRIGYFPASNDCSLPTDRRRFCYYARKKNLQFEIAKPSEKYDVVILSVCADLSVWCNYNYNSKIVFDLVDSYLAIPQWDVKGKLRGLSKFITRQSRYLQLSYHKALQKMCTRADAVICSTLEQRSMIMELCSNTHVILDFHMGDAVAVKSRYDAGIVFNFVWEGLAAGNVKIFKLLRDIIEPIHGQHRVALHLITDLRYSRYHNKYYKCDTLDDINKVFRGSGCNVFLYQWNQHLFSSIASACDLALIPIPLDDRFMNGKPENKLLLFWRLGLPVITSQTPAYKRTMNNCNLQMTCITIDDWISTIEMYMRDESKRRDAGHRGKDFVDRYHGEDHIMSLWDNLFQSIL